MAAHGAKVGIDVEVAILFACLLKRAPDPSAALGSNLIGAMVGGLIEYSSMALGLRAMTLLAIVLYVASLLLVLRRVDPLPGCRTRGTPS